MKCVSLWVLVALAAFSAGAWCGNQYTFRAVVRGAVENGCAEYEVNKVTGEVTARWKSPNRQKIWSAE